MVGLEELHACPGEDGVNHAGSQSQEQDHWNSLGGPEHEDYDLPSTLGDEDSRLDLAMEVDTCSFSCPASVLFSGGNLTLIPV